ncbi:general secretion pathway protein GspB [Vibrio neonatus]|uniref:general secretion pathway protein GspB n=1 Tax=Vibrio neonatus TaxID=278860 RepID=UPI0021C3D305|nr:general secretion pathway protein GspB [Vibrio neonatus]
MSEVLKALEQSQKQFEQASIPTSGQANPSSRPQAGNGKVKLMVAIAVGLGVGVAAHSLLAGSATTRSIEAMLSPALNSVLVAEQAPIAKVQPITPSLDIVYLPATPAKPLLPLPKIVSVADIEETQPVTDTRVVSSSATPAPATSKAETKSEPTTATSKAANNTTSNTTSKEPKKTTPQAADDEWDLSNLDLSQLSPELAGRVTHALDTPSSLDEQGERNSLDHIKVNELDKNVDRYKGRLPALNLQTHMYASNPKHRLVKINGKELQEGDMINDQTKLVVISPRFIVVEFGGEKIQIPALYDWHG